jgi:hypothetical protein
MAGKAEKQKIAEYSESKLAKIKERAYYIWLRKNKPSNTALSDWLEAEQELKKEGKI